MRFAGAVPTCSSSPPWYAMMAYLVGDVPPHGTEATSVALRYGVKQLVSG